MTDLRVWLESQATILRDKAAAFTGYAEYGGELAGHWLAHASQHDHLATLIDDLLEVHFECDCLDTKAIGPHCDCGDSSACTTLRALVPYVSAVTGNTPPEGAA